MWQSISTYILLVWVTSCEYQMYTHEPVPSVGLFQVNNSHPYQAPPTIQVPVLFFGGSLTIEKSPHSFKILETWITRFMTASSIQIETNYRNVYSKVDLGFE